MEQAVQQERRIHVIPATKQAAAPGRASGRRQRVAAYCRVSTDSEEQLTSYTAQKAYYTQKIDENPDWEMTFRTASWSRTILCLRKNAGNWTPGVRCTG